MEEMKKQCVNCLHRKPCFAFGNVLDPIHGGVPCDDYEQEITDRCDTTKLGKLLQSSNASPEKVEAAYKNSGLDIDTVSPKDGHTWWNSQISMSPKGKEYSIQFGTYSKDAFDRVSGLIATIMDEEYAANHY